MRHLRLLLLTMFVASISLALLPATVNAVTKSGDIHVNGLLAGPPPSTAPIVEEPASRSTFQKKSITVKGTCEADLIVRIYRNNIFAGSTICQPDGTYSLTIDLYVGKNLLVARQFDSLDQPSPESNKVVVYYTPPSPPLPPATPNTPSPQPTPPSIDTNPPVKSPSQAPPESIAQFQLIVDYDYTLQRIYTNKPFYLPVVFAGGTGPYAINITWGDGEQTLLSRDTTKKITVKHTYEKPGYYTASITVSDKHNERARVQFVLLVNGDKKSQSSLEAFVESSSLWTWILIFLGVVVLLAISYTIGKKNAVKKPSKL